jgi:pSer/pThr/pTyr-binding forkhead associated (FHA) protein
MTTTAPPQPLAQPTSTPAAGETTAPLQAPFDTLIRDALPLLDHRTRSRTMPAQLALPGQYLALTDGEETRLLKLDSKLTHIGRGAASEVRFEEHRVSRNHAIVVLHGRHARVLDNRSSNGTFVNGRRIVATNLHDGDVIRLGAIAIQYIAIG